MPSVTSGTTNFSMDVDDIIEQAFDPLGGEHISQDEVRKARRTLNLLLIEMQNKNIPLHKIDSIPVSLEEDTQEYLLDFAVQDVLKAVLKYQNIEIELGRMGVKEWHNIPIKTLKQRPTTYSTERLLNGVNLRVWPLPNNDDYIVNLLVAKKIEDIDASYQKIDLPSRYLPLLVAWLSHRLSLSRQGIPADVRAELKQNVIDLMPDTFEEDRERVDSTFVPGGVSGH